MAKSQTQLQADLVAIEAILDAGVSQVDVDGTRTVYDLKALRVRAIEIRRQIRAMSMKRPRSASIHLGGF